MLLLPQHRVLPLLLLLLLLVLVLAALQQLWLLWLQCQLHKALRQQHLPSGSLDPGGCSTCMHAGLLPL
jgi:hypothetical protein